MTKISNQLTFADIDADYKAFIEKFKPKKTTDDCYTPDNVYEAVLDIRNNGGYFGTTEDEVTTMGMNDLVIPITNIEGRNVVIDMSRTEIRISFEED